MAKYSLIALDMDGTLFNSALEVSDGNREAIHRAHEAGKHVILSTGRCLCEMRDTLAILPEIRYLVCENGSCVYDVKYDRTIHVAPVPPREIIYILELVKNERVVLQAFHENQAYFNQKNALWAEDFAVGNYRGVFEHTAVWDERLFDDYASRPFQIEKLNLYFDDPQAQARIHAALESRPLKISDSIGHMIEVVSSLADKGRGLKLLCEYLSLPIEETIAVGDSMNDIEILSAAGFSAAMGNACSEAKAAARVVTDDCDHDGVAKVIRRYLLAE